MKADEKDLDYYLIDNAQYLRASEHASPRALSPDSDLERQMPNDPIPPERSRSLPSFFNVQVEISLCKRGQKEV